jgi:tRNA pseudouridine55 synthase
MKASRVRRASTRSCRRSRRIGLPGTTEHSEAPLIDGILLVDKPAGFTSHDIVAIARGATHTRRIGHTGTLDPFATGLLVLLTGQATRLAQYVDGEPKVYETTILFGTETDTDDLTGTAVRTADAPSASAVDDAIDRLTGPLEQLPPAYSARQAGGVRAYAAARKGTPLELEPSRITVHRWTVLSRDETSITARVECSGGTYIRSLGRDLGRLTNSAAHVTGLRRLASGPFSVDDAVALQDLRAGRYQLIGMERGIRSMPRQSLTPDEAARVTHGNPVSASVAGDRAALIDPQGRVAAIATRVGDNWQPATVFPHA